MIEIYLRDKKEITYNKKDYLQLTIQAIKKTN